MLQKGALTAITSECQLNASAFNLNEKVFSSERKDKTLPHGAFLRFTERNDYCSYSRF